MPDRSSIQKDTTLYTLLALAFNYPDAELVEALIGGDFTDRVKTALGDDARGALEAETKEVEQKYRGFTDDRSTLLLELEREYTRLFLAPRPRLVYLFESVYDEGRLYQESTFDVARLYRQAGLKPTEELRLPPDHIALEFEFMSYLAFNQIEALKEGMEENAEYAAKLGHKMLSEHLGPFAVSVADRMTQHAGHPFYRLVAAIVKAVFR
jgi:TorA maturation chaperone TorD